MEDAVQETATRSTKTPRYGRGLVGANPAHNLENANVRANVHDALGVQYDSVKELHAVINVLFERLNTVLVQVPTNEDPKEAHEPFSVVEKVNMNTDLVRNAFRRLNDIIERLEV